MGFETYNFFSSHVYLWLEYYVTIHLRNDKNGGCIHPNKRRNCIVIAFTRRQLTFAKNCFGSGCKLHSKQGFLKVNHKKYGTCLKCKRHTDFVILFFFGFVNVKLKKSENALLLLMFHIKKHQKPTQESIILCWKRWNPLYSKYQPDKTQQRLFRIKTFHSRICDVLHNRLNVM